MNEWKPIEELVQDNRMVEFKAPSGIFRAPAQFGRAPTRQELVAIYRHAGTWPNVKHNPTHYREIRGRPPPDGGIPFEQEPEKRVLRR